MSDDPIGQMKADFINADGNKITIGILPSDFVRLLDYAGLLQAKLTRAEAALKEIRDRCTGTSIVPITLHEIATIARRYREGAE